MIESSRRVGLPPVRSMVPGALVALGVLLWMVAGKAWLVVAGLGAFGPGILRELGWLDDLDEFQREASRRAAHHAYLIGGLVTTLVITGLHLDGRPPEFPAELITFILVVFWLTWMFSYLMAYWGPTRTASRVLLAFGGFWALFVVLDAIGEASDVGEALLGLAIGTLFVAPFALGAWAAGRWPRSTGLMLLVAGAGLLMVVAVPGRGTWTTRLLTPALLVVPLIASGLGLLRVGGEQETID